MTRGDGEVVEFIQGFSDAKELFLCGYCYWFAVILANRFHGEIWYMPIENHFICRIDGFYYDVTGRMRPENIVYRWSDYPDELEKKRIIRDCVNKEKYEENCC